MKKMLFSAALGAACVLASAASSGSASDSTVGAGFVPEAMAQRVMHFTDGRIWQRSDGVVLVCPLSEAADRCKRSERSMKSWVDVHAVTIEGFRISGVQFYFAGQNAEKNLLVFFAKSNPLTGVIKQQR